MNFLLKHSAALLGTLLISINTTVIYAALPAIGADFQQPLSALQWVINGYVLPIALLILVFSITGDHLGHRRVFTAAMIFFAAGSVLAALSPGLHILILSRVIQGFGGAMLMASSQPLIMLEGNIKSGAAAYSAALGGGSVLGPILGGALVSTASWRLIFWLNVALAVASILLRTFASPSRDSTAPRPSDGAPKKLFSWQVFSNRDVVISMGAAALGNACLIGLAAYATTFIIDGLGYSAIMAGVILLPLSVGALLGAVLSSRLREAGPFALMIGALVLMGIGLALMSPVTDHSPGWVLAPGGVLAGLGLGLLTSATSRGAVQATPRQWTGAASGAVSMMRQLGTFLGVFVWGLFIAGAVTAGDLRSILLSAAASVLVVALLITAIQLKTSPNN